MTARRLLALVAVVLAPSAVHAEFHYLIVSGLGGDPVYAERFASDAAAMQTAAERTVGDSERVHLLSGEAATREALRDLLTELAATLVPADRLAVVLIGHGSYDGTDYKFNLPGPDIDGTELGELLAAIPAASQLIVNTTSASGSVLEPWAAVEGRHVITATRSGAERNATRFAEHWAAALSSDDADLNKNGSISAQEAFDFAARSVADSFESQDALATEHPELRGEAAGAFEVARLTARAAPSAATEPLLAERDALLDEIAALRLQREELGDDYQARMLELQVRLAEVQEQIDAAETD